MSIGKVIRKYRKQKNITQEEMAERLGVTAPAVNKWENENSFPDILLLAPIARLLGISLDTLLSFREDLTMEEINEIIREADQKIKEMPFEEVFGWVKKKLEEYPNCETLILNLAVLLDAQRMVQKLPNDADYDAYLCSLYIRILNSEDETIRLRAADCLVGFYRRQKQYEKAEKYLEYFSIQNPERKRKQAEIYAETGRVEEAYRAYEELLFSDYSRASMELHGMYMLALKSNDKKRAGWLAARQGELARVFDMGRYYEVSSEIEIAALEKDADRVIGIMREMLSSVETIGDFRNAPLYEHMEFKAMKEEMKEEFAAGMKEKLLECFCEEETFGFLKEDERWKELVGR